jgi:hypothetical protein
MAKKETEIFSFQLFKKDFFCKIYIKVALFFDGNIIL